MSRLWIASLNMHQKPMIQSSKCQTLPSKLGKGNCMWQRMISNRFLKYLKQCWQMTSKKRIQVKLNSKGKTTKHSFGFCECLIRVLKTHLKVKKWINQHTSYNPSNQQIWSNSGFYQSFKIGWCCLDLYIGLYNLCLYSICLKFCLGN